jgi:hypothetical protein
MPFKFLHGDTVRQIGTSDALVVEQIESSGLQYMLKASDSVVSTIEWAQEDQLELVKRASDSETGWKLWYVT